MNRILKRAPNLENDPDTSLTKVRSGYEHVLSRVKQLSHDDQLASQ